MGPVLVLGAYGLLGSSLCPALSANGLTVLRQGRGDSAQLRLDPLQAEQLQSALVEHKVWAVLNLVAATNVDRCQQDCAYAFEANVHAVEMLGKALNSLPARNRPHVVHISTDHLYDGTGPHREDQARPGNIYALSKYAGELAAARLGATILRTNFFGRSTCQGRMSFTDWIITSLRAGRSIPVFEDSLISALHMRALSLAILRVLEQPRAGIFNLGCSNGMSKAEIAFRLAEILGLSQDLLRPCRMAEANLAAPRPLDMTMDSTLFADSFAFELPDMQSQLIFAAREYNNE